MANIKSAIIEYHNYKFMITDSPNVDTIDKYIELYKLHRVRTIVRLCDPIYNSSVLEHSGFRFVDMPFADGSVPDRTILDRWNGIVTGHKNDMIAVHCLSGLGRAPFLVCMSLIECGMEKIDAVEMIRNNRNGALNSKQIQFIINYHPNKQIYKFFSCLFQ